MRPNLRFVQSYVHQGRVGVLVEFGVETWDVTKSEQFLEISQNVAEQIAAVNPESVEALLQQAYLRDPTVTLQKKLSDAAGVLGKRIRVIKFVRWANEPRPLPDGRSRFIQSYVLAGRLGVLVEFGLDTWLVTERPEFLEFSRALAMHIALAHPESLAALLHKTYDQDPAVTIEKLLAGVSRLVREKITITRFCRLNDEPEPPRDPKNPAVAMRLKRA